MAECKSTPRFQAARTPGLVAARQARCPLKLQRAATHTQGTFDPPTYKVDPALGLDPIDFLFNVGCVLGGDAGLKT